MLSVARLEKNKRVDLAVRAMAHLPPHLRLIVVGDGSFRPFIEREAEESGASDRITFAGAVNDDALVALYRDALCLVYAPYDEDYGLATLEAFLAQKPVITARDSGGTLEFVRDGDNGFVVDPDPVAIADAIAPARRRSRARPRRSAAAVAIWRARSHGTPSSIVSSVMADPQATSVVIPAFGEGPAIAAVVTALLRSARTGTRSSSWTTARRTRPRGSRRKPACSVIRHPYNKGNGASVKTGIRHATGEWILIVDGDGQHHPGDAVRLVELPRRLRPRRRRTLGRSRRPPPPDAAATTS